MKLKLNKIKISNSKYKIEKLPITLKKGIEYLNSLDYAECVTLSDISTVLNLGHRGFREYTSHPSLQPYKFKYRNNRILLGNKKTIEALKNEYY